MMTMSTTTTTCSCGSTTPHRVRRGHTADGVPVEAWSDGDLTIMGFAVRGSGVAHSEGRRLLNRRAAEMVVGEASLFTRDELPALLHAARKLARTKPQFTPGDLRLAAGAAGL